MKIHQADLFFLGQDSLSNKENNKTIKRTFVQDSPCFKNYEVKIHHVQKWNRLRFTNPEIYIPQDSTSRWHRIFDDPWGGEVQGAHWRLHKYINPVRCFCVHTFRYVWSKLYKNNVCAVYISVFWLASINYLWFFFFKVSNIIAHALFTPFVCIIPW